MYKANNPEIFISYSWRNKDIADEIDNRFKSVGITLRRDERDATYRASIKEFMQQISKTDYVLMIISDEFLRSENCMYEVIELLNEHAFEKRILPVVLNNAQGIFKGPTRIVYYDYWEMEWKEAEKRKKKHPNTDTVNQAKHYQNIYNSLDSFFEKITDVNVLTFARLQQENYRPILDFIGIEDPDLLQQVLEIDKLEDEEDKELALEEFLGKNPHNKYGLFLKAFIEASKDNPKKAKRYYLDLLQL
ncbi:MAG: toll/interleukin-1 receptor domain-containing protein, partial [Flavisolibacter sp.]|nr:toll/interleukin-1 receptor domain-containing protein [Flavisolibacter sp.]